MMKIAVIRFSSIGDIVLTIPTIHALRELYPAAEIHFVTKSVFGDLFSAEPSITKQHLLQKKESLRSFKKTLIGESFDLVVDLHDNLRSQFLCRGLGSKTVRYKKKRLRRFLYLHLKKRESVTPVWERYRKTITNTHSVPKFSFTLPESTHIKADKITPSVPFLLLSPGSTWATKEWPMDKYRELANQLRSSNFPIVVIGGEKDREIQELFSSILGERIVPLAGELSIVESAAVVKRAAFMLTVDTGMMHIASAFGTPQAVLFGSTVEEFGFFPVSGSAEVFQLDLPCRPCSHTGKPACPKKHHRCMNDISVSDVADKIFSYLPESK